MDRPTGPRIFSLFPRRRSCYNRRDRTLCRRMTAMTDRREFFRRCAGLAAATAVAAAPRVAAQGTVTEGVDVSHWQGTINWATVAGAGIKFAFCKATEGTTYVDPT